MEASRGQGICRRDREGILGGRGGGMGEAKMQVAEHAVDDEVRAVTTEAALHWSEVHGG